jgi:hypothetical protein
MIRVGSSPYEFMQMAFDQEYNKWVAPYIWVARQHGAGPAFNTSTTYVGMSYLEASNTLIPNFRALYEAGLKPQVFCSGFLDNSGANDTFLRAGIVDVSDDDTSTLPVSEDIMTGAEISNNGTTQTWQTSPGWQDVTVAAAPDKDHAYVRLEYRVSGGTGTWAGCGLGLRWVADPA